MIFTAKILFPCIFKCPCADARNPGNPVHDKLPPVTTLVKFVGIRAFPKPVSLLCMICNMWLSRCWAVMLISPNYCLCWVQLLGQSNNTSFPSLLWNKILHVSISFPKAIDSGVFNLQPSRCCWAITPVTPHSWLWLELLANNIERHTTYPPGSSFMKRT